MRMAVRPDDTVARLDGDEFAVLFEDIDIGDVERAVLHIASKLQAPLAIGDQMIGARASFGLVDGRTGDDAEDLLRSRDMGVPQGFPDLVDVQQQTHIDQVTITGLLGGPTPSAIGRLGNIQIP